MANIRRAVLVFMAVLLIVVATPINAFAVSNATLFAYTNCDLGAQEYAGSMLCSFARAYGYAGDFSEITLGTGISIYDPDDYEKTLFPVWQNNEIVDTLLVVNTGDYYTGTYSVAYAEQLNGLQDIATKQMPISLVADESLYAVIGNKWYDLNGKVGSYVEKTTIQTPFENIVNASVSVSFLVTPQPRFPTSFFKNFTIYRTQLQNEGFCYDYAMTTILVNMMTNLNPNNVIIVFNSIFNSLANYVGKPGAMNSEVAGFLNYSNYNCRYTDLGYLTFENVRNTLYYSNSYIYISVGLIQDDGIHVSQSSHALVIFGYSDDGVNQFYTLWDPYDSYSKVVQVVNPNYLVISGYNTASYLWDAGYITNIISK